MQKRAFSVSKKMAVCLKKIHMFLGVFGLKQRFWLILLFSVPLCPVTVPSSVPLLFPYFSMVFSVYGTVGQRKTYIAQNLMSILRHKV